MKVAYWPGCVSRGFTPELHGSMEKVAPLLDLQLIPLDRAACCGAGVIAEHNQELADTLNARTFALAQQTDGELMMNICSTCQGAQTECQRRLDANPDYREHINQNLASEGLTYDAPITNKNFLWMLVEEIGLDTLREKVKRPLTQLRVGPFYGCYIVRPVDRLAIDDERSGAGRLQRNARRERLFPGIAALGADIGAPIREQHQQRRLPGVQQAGGIQQRSRERCSAARGHFDQCLFDACDMPRKGQNEIRALGAKYHQRDLVAILIARGQQTQRRAFRHLQSALGRHRTAGIHQKQDVAAPGTAPLMLLEIGGGQRHSPLVGPHAPPHR